jgi:hypothetical protein
VTIPPTPSNGALEAMRAASDTYGLLADTTVGEYPTLYTHLAELISLWVTVTNHRVGRTAAPYYTRVCQEFKVNQLEELELERFEVVVNWLTTRIQAA